MLRRATIVPRPLVVSCLRIVSQQTLFSTRESGQFSDRRLAEFRDTCAVVERDPVERLAVVRRGGPPADGDQLSHELTGDRLVLKRPAGPPRSQGDDQRLEGREALVVDDGALLEGEGVVIDRVGRTDGDALTAAPALLRADRFRGPVVEFEHVRDAADVDARSATHARGLVHEDLRHPPPFSLRDGALYVRVRNRWGDAQEGGTV